ncbi:hypothetical protein HJ590_12050 [Naumannella sp. ID2617S]|nr:hypothetical protein [Naumannella sp. ID2617S]
MTTPAIEPAPALPPTFWPARGTDPRADVLYRLAGDALVDVATLPQLLDLVERVAPHGTRRLPAIPRVAAPE